MRKRETKRQRDRQSEKDLIQPNTSAWVRERDRERERQRETKRETKRQRDRQSEKDLVQPNTSAWVREDVDVSVEVFHARRQSISLDQILVQFIIRLCRASPPQPTEPRSKREKKRKEIYIYIYKRERKKKREKGIFNE